MDAQLRLMFDVRGELLDAAKACELDVFDAAYGNSPQELDAEYGPYDDASVFIALVDPTGRVQGACRVITWGEPGLKSLNDLSREPWRVDGLRSARAAGIDPVTTWDIATLGVRSELGRTGVMAAAALYHGLVAGGRANDVTTMITIVDQRVRTLLHGVGLATHVLPGARPAEYLGSAKSTPVYAHLAAVVDHQRRHTPDAYRMITLGVGLSGVVQPAPEEWRLRPRDRVVVLPGGGDVEESQRLAPLDVGRSADPVAG
jgi:hypothetical protein